jgi:hypothetical protein
MTEHTCSNCKHWIQQAHLFDGEDKAGDCEAVSYKTKPGRGTAWIPAYALHTKPNHYCSLWAAQ